MSALTRNAFHDLPVDAVAPRRQPWVVWVLAMFLFVTFFAATQDMDNPARWIDDGEADIAGWVGRVEQGQAQRQLGFLALGAFGALGIVLPSRHGRPAGIDWVLMYLLVATVAWSSASILWSIEPTFTAKRLVVFTSMWMAVAAIVKHFDLRDLAFCSLFYGVASLGIGVVAELKAGTLGAAAATGPWRMAGAMHPNHLGLTMSVMLLSAAYFFTQSYDRRRQAVFGSLMAVSLLVIYLTRSRTSLAAALVGLGVFTSLRLTFRQNLVLIGCALLPLVIGAFSYGSGAMGEVWEVALMGRKESDVTTLTGRTDIWQFSIDHLWADPTRLFIGVGYNSFFTAENTAAVSRYTGFTISEAHSAYLETWLNLGIAGLVCFTLTLVVGAGKWLAVGRTRRGRYRADVALAVGLVAFAMVHGLVESAMSHAHFATLVVFTAIAIAAVRLRPIREARQLEAA